MRHSDWLRLRERVEAVASPQNWAAQVGWGSVGVAATALLGLLPWVAASSQLPQAAKNHYAWITPLLAVLGIATLALAVICWAFSRTLRVMEKQSIKIICADMDAIYEPHRRTDTAGQHSGG